MWVTILSDSKRGGLSCLDGTITIVLCHVTCRSDYSNSLRVLSALALIVEEGMKKNEGVIVLQVKYRKVLR